MAPPPYRAAARKTTARAERSDETFNSFRAGGELEAQSLEEFADLGFNHD
jgi:hypothetical protein